ncbi:MAG: nucleotide exchange factor GrpE [Bacteroidota bacterium]
MSEELKHELEGEEILQDTNTDFQEDITETEEVRTSEQEADTHEQLVADLKAEIAALKDAQLRKVAEMENMRKRLQRERVQLFEDAKIKALEDFLPISEDLVRALSAAEHVHVEEGFLNGVKMVSVKFEETLTKYGVERIEETGVPFNVDIHDALLRQAALDEKTGSDVVLQVIENGYKIGERVLKHAKVIVSA